MRVIVKVAPGDSEPRYDVTAAGHDVTITKPGPGAPSLTTAAHAFFPATGPQSLGDLYVDAVRPVVTEVAFQQKSAGCIVLDGAAPLTRFHALHSRTEGLLGYILSECATTPSVAEVKVGLVEVTAQETLADAWDDQRRPWIRECYSAAFACVEGLLLVDGAEEAALERLQKSFNAARTQIVVVQLIHVGDAAPTFLSVVSVASGGGADDHLRSTLGTVAAALVDPYPPPSIPFSKAKVTMLLKGALCRDMQPAVWVALLTPRGANGRQELADTFGSAEAVLRSAGDIGKTSQQALPPGFFTGDVTVSPQTPQDSPAGRHSATRLQGPGRGDSVSPQATMPAGLDDADIAGGGALASALRDASESHGRSLGREVSAESGRAVSQPQPSSTIEALRSRSRSPQAEAPRASDDGALHDPSLSVAAQMAAERARREAEAATAAAAAQQEKLRREREALQAERARAAEAERRSQQEAAQEAAQEREQYLAALEEQRRRIEASEQRHDAAIARLESERRQDAARHETELRRVRADLSSTADALVEAQRHPTPPSGPAFAPAAPSHPREQIGRDTPTPEHSAFEAARPAPAAPPSPQRGSSSRPQWNSNPRGDRPDSRPRSSSVVSDKGRPATPAAPGAGPGQQGPRHTQPTATSQRKRRGSAPVSPRAGSSTGLVSTPREHSAGPSRGRDSPSTRRSASQPTQDPRTPLTNAQPQPRFATPAHDGGPTMQGPQRESSHGSTQRHREGGQLVPAGGVTAAQHGLYRDTMEAALLRLRADIADRDARLEDMARSVHGLERQLRDTTAEVALQRRRADLFAADATHAPPAVPREAANPEAVWEREARLVDELDAKTERCTALEQELRALRRSASTPRPVAPPADGHSWGTQTELTVEELGSQEVQRGIDKAAARAAADRIRTLEAEVARLQGANSVLQTHAAARPPPLKQTHHPAPAGAGRPKSHSQGRSGSVENPAPQRNPPVPTARRDDRAGAGAGGTPRPKRDDAASRPSPDTAVGAPTPQAAGNRGGGESREKTELQRQLDAAIHALALAKHPQSVDATPSSATTALPPRSRASSLQSPSLHDDDAVAAPTHAATSGLTLPRPAGPQMGLQTPGRTTPQRSMSPGLSAQQITPQHQRMLDEALRRRASQRRATPVH